MKKCKICGNTTQFMYPVLDYFFCEYHSGNEFGHLCCSNCFEPYKDLFPEREAIHPGSGHCNGNKGCCHAFHRQLLEDDHKAKGDGALKNIELSVSAVGNPMITIDTERNHYTIYWRQANEMFRAYAEYGGKCLNHFKPQRQTKSNHGSNEAIDIVSFFNGTRDVTKHMPFDDNHIGHELKIPPHVERSGENCPC